MLFRSIRIIDEDRYPSSDTAVISEAIREAVEGYRDLAEYKEVDAAVSYDAEQGVITCNRVVFDLDRMIVQGRLATAEQDFRDYLRRRGIKFYTGEAFESVSPPKIAKLLNVDLPKRSN